MRITLAALVLSAAIAVVPTAAPSLPGEHSVDLGNGRFDGRIVLGRTISGVTAALGRPDFRGPRVVGWGPPPDFRYAVLFRPHARVLHATAIVLERGNFRDPILGDMLAEPPRMLTRDVARVYGAQLRLSKPYHCRTGGICDAVFAARTGRIGVTVGTTRVHGRFVTVWQS